MKPRSPILTLIVAIVVLLSTFVSAADQTVVPAKPIEKEQPDRVVVVRAYYQDIEDIQRLVDFDVFEYNNHEEKYVLVAVDDAGFRRLEALGFRPVVDDEETANFALLSTPLRGDAQVQTIPGYSCYRTVEETYAAAQALAAAHPTLVTWTDVGNSWEKSVGQPDGYDMMVLKLTNSAITGDKPKLFITGAIHAREYTTAETATRFAEYLVNNYGADADATWLLDHHEIHLLLQVNPDGRKEAEAGRSWRKNTNENYCGVTSTSRGADLNRNFPFYWNYCSGCSSGTPCNETYRGPTAGSEPETQAVQNYMLSIFPDQRAAALSSPAPADATGVYVDLHSYAQLVLWPWGFQPGASPNATALQTLGRKFAYFNSYTPEQSYQLYGTDGTTDDFAYGELGVAAFTIEMGTAFFESCTSFTNTTLPTNLQALFYAAKVVRTPYQTPAGPDALSLALSAAEVPMGDPTTLTAAINDTRYKSGTGEPTQNIAAAEYYVDAPPWQAGAVANAMAASDGSFSSTVENVTATVSTGSLAAGRHILFVRGKDANNNWGAFSAIFLTITGPANQAPTADSQSVSTAEDTALAITLTGSDPESDPLTFSVVSGPSHGTLSGSAPNLTYTPAANYNGADSFSFVANDGHSNSAAATVNITISPVNDAPVANPQSVTTQQDTGVAITLAGSDVDGDALTYTVQTQPGHGTLSGTAPNLTYTPASGYSGSDSFTFVVSDGQASSAAATVSITVNAAGAKLYLGSSTSGTAGGVAFADEDILIKNTGAGAWSLFIDGSDIGLANTDIDAFELLPDGSMLVSFDTDFSLSGFGTVDDSDILKFTPTSTGSTTAGTWSWYFDGSDVGLSTTDEDVDALALLSDGRLLISTLGNVSVTGASGVDEDLLAFTPTALGATTSGTWAMYFDGSDVGLSNTSNEDVNGVWVDAAGKIYLTTLGNFSVTGVSGDGSDIIVCTPGSVGGTTTCTWTMYWDGSVNGFSGEDTDSLSVMP